MSDITPMPNNATNYYRKAINALQNNDDRKGIHFLEESYQLDPQDQVFYELVNLYIKHNLTSKLKSIWKSKNFSLDTIANSAVLSVLYAQTLINMDTRHESLSELYQLRDLIQDSESLLQINQAIDAIQNILSTQKKLDELNSDDDIDNFVKFYLQSSQLELLSKLKSLYLFDLDKTLAVYLAILQKDEIYNFIKNDVLHFLISKGYLETINYSWFGKKNTININELKPYNNTEYYRKAIQLITDFFTKQDPHLESQIIELFNLHSMVLYPYYDEAIDDPAKWLNHTLMIYDLISESEYNSVSPLTAEEVTFYHQAQDEISNLLSNLLSN
ncbi:hypothetical protein ACF3NG_04605 [Aerococcaceae bacterium WGS1372]